MTTIPTLTKVKVGIPGPPGFGVSAAQWAALQAIVASDGSGAIVSPSTVRVQSAATIRSGSGSPEGAVSGSVGDLYLQTNGDAVSALWWKANGAATVNGWVPVDGSVKNRWRSGAHANPDAATLATIGSTAWTSPATASNSNQISGPYIDYASGNVSGNASGPNGPAIYRGDWGVDATFHVRMVETAAVRLHVGLYASDPSGADNPSVETAGFRYSTGAPDTNWQCRYRSNTTSGGVDSGVAYATGEWLFRVLLTASALRWYINDQFIAQQTSNIPQSTTLLAPFVRVTTLAAAAKSVQMGFANLLCR